MGNRVWNSMVYMGQEWNEKGGNVRIWVSGAKSSKYEVVRPEKKGPGLAVYAS